MTSFNAVVAARGNAEELKCLVVLQELRQISCEYIHRLAETHSVGLERQICVRGTLDRIIETFDDSFRSRSSFSKVAMRGVLNAFLPLETVVMSAFKRFPQLGLSKQRVDADRDKFRAFYAWLSS
jgi:hypothetical protein